MAASTTIDVEYEVDRDDGGMDTLDFQDIPHSSDAPEKGKTHEFTNFPHSAVDSDDEGQEDSSKLLKEEKPVSSSSFWTFSYYQQFFDVDTKQVGLRIIGSMLPKPGRNYLVKEIRPKPDLYGPFWICTTLVFTTAIAGNLANYFSSAGKDYHWRYDFHKVTFAATAIFSYWWLIPLVLFGLMWWQGYRERFSFLEMICVYGYSLAIYIPISVLWAIQIAWLQWTLLVLGAVLSGSVLLLTFWPAVSEGNKKIAIGVMVFIFVMHLALAAGFVLYFFHVPVASSIQPSPITNSSATLAQVHPQSSLKVKQNLMKSDNKGTPKTKDAKEGSILIHRLQSSNSIQQNPSSQSGNKQKKEAVNPFLPVDSQKGTSQAVHSKDTPIPPVQKQAENPFASKQTQTEPKQKGTAGTEPAKDKNVRL